MVTSSKGEGIVHVEHFLALSVLSDYTHSCKQISTLASEHIACSTDISTDVFVRLLQHISIVANISLSITSCYTDR